MIISSVYELAAIPAMVYLAVCAIRDSRPDIALLLGIITVCYGFLSGWHKIVTMDEIDRLSVNDKAINKAKQQSEARK